MLPNFYKEIYKIIFWRSKKNGTAFSRQVFKDSQLCASIWKKASIMTLKSIF